MGRAKDFTNLRKILQAEQDLRKQLGREPTPNEVGEVSGIKPSEFEAIREACAHPNNGEYETGSLPPLAP